MIWNIGVVFDGDGILVAGWIDGVGWGSFERLCLRMVVSDVLLFHSFDHSISTVALEKSGRTLCSRTVERPHMPSLRGR